jgi:hypothetical protein
MTTTVDIYAERDQRAAQLGWTHVSDHACPRRLVGRNCLNDYRPCWCSYLLPEPYRNPLNDHGNTWRGRGGVQFVLWEPYGADCDELAYLISEHARDDGLRVWITSSVWNPPHTVGIRFQADNR